MSELVVDAPDTADSLRNAVVSRIMRLVSKEIWLIAYVLLMAPYHRDPTTTKLPRRHNNDYDHTVPQERYNGHGWGEFLRITMHHHMDYLFIEDLGKWHWDRKVMKRDRTCPTIHMIAPLMNNVLVSRHLCELLRQSLRCIDFFRSEFIDSHPRLCLAFVGWVAEHVKKPMIGGLPDSFYHNIMNHVPRLWYRDAYPGALGYTHPEGTHRTMVEENKPSRSCLNPSHRSPYRDNKLVRVRHKTNRSHLRGLVMVMVMVKVMVTVKVKVMVKVMVKVTVRDKVRFKTLS
jgi:hypothetical protein